MGQVKFLSELYRDVDGRCRARAREGSLSTVLLGNKFQGPRSVCEKEKGSLLAVGNGGVGSGPSEENKKKPQTNLIYFFIFQELV